MEKHLELDDAAFIKAFEDCSLDPSVFSHEAHLRLAWICLQRYGAGEATARICDQLNRFVKHIGAEDKFNLTLTIAATKAVYHFMQKSAAENFQRFILEFPQLKYSFKALIATHYSSDIFNTPAVKKYYLEPDLVPFDY